MDRRANSVRNAFVLISCSILFVPVFFCSESVGLCGPSETSNQSPVLLVTFGNGNAQYSKATPASYGFSSTYKQKFMAKTTDGHFSFINLIKDDFGSGAWHAGAKDHTMDGNGYMMLVNAETTRGQFYNRTIGNLCVGQRYELSVYLANVCAKQLRCPTDPNVRFEMRSSPPENKLLAEYSSGNVPVHNTTMIWKQYGFSFVPSTSSVVLLMISSIKPDFGNDVALDDIALRPCSSQRVTGCPAV